MNITDQADHDELAAAQQQYQMAMTNADQFSAGLQVAELLSSQSRFNEALAALQLIRPLACSTVDQASLQQKLGWAQLRLCQYDLAYQHFCDALSLL
ncbi:MAG TPA: hypothetical protein VMF29_06850, partial [Candidatus Edwardsbacteria bacterium]|nr:hypothetical protein [Candidatus Edwardsbacteria bacterium]